MSFSPDASTRMCATPVRPSTVRTSSSSTPYDRRPSRTISRNGSRPTQPASHVRAPARADATAWFAPLPPSTRVKSSPSTVSPRRGNRALNAVTSAVMLPTTRTPWDSIAVLLFRLFEA